MSLADEIIIETNIKKRTDSIKKEVKQLGINFRKSSFKTSIYLFALSAFTLIGGHWVFTISQGSPFLIWSYCVLGLISAGGGACVALEGYYYPKRVAADFAADFQDLFK